MTPAVPAGKQAFPCQRHLKSSSPQMSVQDKEIIHAIFADSVIREEFGKLCAPSLALDWQIKRLIEVEAKVS
jgi:hypothetical protein